MRGCRIVARMERAANTMRFGDEVRGVDEIKTPKAVKISKAEMQLAHQLIEQLTKPSDPAEYHDTYQEELERIIEEKAAGKKLPHKANSQQRYGKAVGKSGLVEGAQAVARLGSTLEMHDVAGAHLCQAGELLLDDQLLDGAGAEGIGPTPGRR